MKRCTIALSIALSSLLAACNSDKTSTSTSTSTNNKPLIITGVFQDSAVEVLEYSTPVIQARNSSRPVAFICIK